MADIHDDAVHAARARSSATDHVPDDATGQFLAWLARGHGVRAAVEVGSAAGVSGLWLLRGLADRGVLTSVEEDAHRHGLATQAYAEAGVADRVRAIEGDPATVLPRLADGGYDLVLLQQGDDPDALRHARRLVREDGVVVARRAGAKRPARGVVQGLTGAEDASDLVDDADFDTVVLPVDDGLLLARRRPTPG